MHKSITFNNLNNVTKDDSNPQSRSQERNKKLLFKRNSKMANDIELASKRDKG